MPRAKLRCPKCSRSFSMAAHLARHMNTIHGGGGRRKKRRAPGRRGKKRGRKPGRPRATYAAQRSAGTFAPARLLDDIRTFHGDLLSQRADIDAQIGNLEAAMDALGSSRGAAARTPARRGPGRPPGRRAKRRGRPPGRRTAARRGRPPGRRTAARRGRPPGGGRAGSLKDMIQKVLRQTSGAMSPTEIASAVKSAGYRTKAKDLTKAVSNTLPELTSVKKVGFGQYRM